LPLGGISENPSSSPFTTPLLHLASHSPIPFHLSRHWIDLFSRLHLISWEEGDKGPEGKSKIVKDKSQELNLKMLRVGIPKKEIKGFSTRNKRDP
jgi:hypothetical protein